MEEIPRYLSIDGTAKEMKGKIPAHAIRQMVKDGTIPTRTIKVGNRVLLNYDLLIKNLSMMDSDEEK